MQAAPLHNDLAEGPAGGQAWWLTASDGVRIRAAHWPGGSNGTIFLFPGRTEYIEKYGQTASDFGKHGYGMVAIDWRGQGLADRLADDVMLGHVGSIHDYQRDVAAVLDLAKAQNLPKPWFLIGHSMGGCIGLRSLHENLPVDAAVFSAPMWGVGMAPYLRPVAWSLSWASRFVGLGTAYVLGTKPLSYVLTSPFEGNSLTGDEDMWNYMKRHVEAEPGFRLGGASLQWLYEALRETRALRSAGPPPTPALTFLGGRESIIDTPSVHTIMSNWTSGQLDIVADAQHEFLMEGPAIRADFVQKSVDWFEKLASA